MNSTADGHRQRSRIAVRGQRIKQRQEIGLIPDRVKAGNYSGPPKPRQTQAFLRQPLGEACLCVRRKLPPPSERKPAENRFRIAVS